VKLTRKDFIAGAMAFAASLGLAVADEPAKAVTTAPPSGKPPAPSGTHKLYDMVMTGDYADGAFKARVLRRESASLEPPFGQPDGTVQCVGRRLRPTIIGVACLYAGRSNKADLPSTLRLLRRRRSLNCYVQSVWSRLDARRVAELYRAAPRPTRTRRARATTRGLFLVRIVVSDVVEAAGYPILRVPHPERPPSAVR
jgi:hypothetical protein